MFQSYSQYVAQHLFIVCDCRIVILVDCQNCMHCTRKQTQTEQKANRAHIKLHKQKVLNEKRKSSNRIAGKILCSAHTHTPSTHQPNRAAADAVTARQS